jgi:hypothetical protein
MNTILFVCPHGAAKSVLAAADFQQLAQARGLEWRATCAGTEPDEALSPTVRQTLQAENIGLPVLSPRQLTPTDLQTAARIISLGAALPPGAVVERWDDVPPVSADLPAARAVIRAHLERLVDELAE